MLRVFKLASKWKSFQNLLKTMGHTVMDIGYFSVLVWISVLTFTVLGMEIFAHKVKYDEETRHLDLVTGTSPQQNFDSLLNAYYSVFIVLANDGWSTIYINHFDVVGYGVASMFFISLLIIGQYILLNLFLAILLQNFDNDSVTYELEKK